MQNEAKPMHSQSFYSCQSLYTFRPIQHETLLWDDRACLESLVKLVKLYRKHFLYIPQTQFHRPVSRYLQQELGFLEQIRREKVLGTYLAKRRRKKAEPSKISTTAKSDSEGDDADRPIHELLGEDVIAPYLPDRHTWNGRVVFVREASIEEMMEALLSTGILDCSVPRVTYALGIRSFREGAFGVRGTWIAVGYISDIALLDRDAF
ncbi:hypothetical protein BJ742DRAFT_782165 [Cladochytrium replicatum]|nr:hypothetical protein BJ742DRAFT_782165 [Cladochytrium replicatum]